jgi:tRNA(Arg) A34 adenosine deaminase TadA
MPSPEFMRLALQRAREGVARGQAPFGACIVRDGRVVACEHNAVWDHTDSTAHAEVQAIRVACQRLSTVDLSDCEIYATCEPCPMCFSAIHWAKISTIVFGSRIADARGLGFSELTISNQQMKELGGSPLAIVPDYLREECAALFRDWAGQAHRRTY